MSLDFLRRLGELDRRVKALEERLDRKPLDPAPLVPTVTVDTRTGKTVARGVGRLRRDGTVGEIVV